MILDVKSIGIFYQCSYPTAIKRRNEINTFFKKNSKHVFLSHLAKYEAIAEDEILKMIANLIRKNKSPKTA